jgi:DNA-binding CsgD family transcriptional regulator
MAGGRRLPLLDPLHRPVFAQGLVAAELFRGRPDEARQWIGLMERSVADSRGGDVLANRTGHIALSHAKVHMAAGQPAQAAEWATKAVLAFGTIDHVLNEAECREMLGAALAASGDHAAAIAELTETAKMYDACQLSGRRDGVYRQLRALGHNAVAPRSSAMQATLPQLTARETEVARLVADGLTNRQIMQRLRLSRRTVETHISNIRVKLDVGSRAALATTVIRASQAS